MRVIGGIRMSSVNDFTTVANAAPRMTPTPRSTTLPLRAKSLNSLIKLMRTPKIHSAPMIRTIAIIGTGTMGRGIAYLSAVAGYDTILYDAEAAALDAARASIDSTLRKGAEKGKVADDVARASIERVHLANDLEPAVRGADLIIEAVPENFELKKDLFAQADLFCSEDAILASNTSSISISKLASSVERRDRFVGLHFFNPPHVMKLIEIVRGDRTSDATLAQAREVAEKMGKTPIIVRDSPGFATSRLGVAIE